MGERRAGLGVDIRHYGRGILKAMALFRKPDTISCDNMRSLDDLCPLKDEIFLYLLERALKGTVQVYYAEVSRTYIRRFDTNYDPRSHEVGKIAVAEVMDNWRKGRFKNVWVYEQQNHFVLSDDYITWAAAEEGQPDRMPCWILGEPTIDAAKNVQGPIAASEIPKLLGLPV
jgi:hypothetical protein